tara:strand:- start:537 stop:833 length:297 start_codon:yes stop_codon:yes gene_type:complete
MAIVLVEFPVGPEDTEACARAVGDLTATLVAGQPEFHGAILHTDAASGHVLNYMEWDSHAAFIAFRDANADAIGAAIGRFSPQGRMLDIVRTVASESA